jgi:hypothetical protein
MELESMAPLLHHEGASAGHCPVAVAPAVALAFTGFDSGESMAVPPENLILDDARVSVW